MDNLVEYLAGLITGVIILLGWLVTQGLKTRKEKPDEEKPETVVDHTNIIDSVVDDIGRTADLKRGNIRNKARDIISGIFSNYSDSKPDNDVRNGDADSNGRSWEDGSRDD